MDWSRGSIRDGMDVCDTDGEKIGSLEGVITPRGHGPSTRVTDDSYLWVDAAYLGLGTELYVPARFIHEVRGDCGLLTIGRNSIEHMGWERTPDELDYQTA